MGRIRPRPVTMRHRIDGHEHGQERGGVHEPCLEDLVAGTFEVGPPIRATLAAGLAVARETHVEACLAHRLRVVEPSSHACAPVASWSSAKATTLPASWITLVPTSAAAPPTSS